MKTGRSIVELAQELERQVESRKDYLADTRAIEIKANPEAPEKLTMSGLNGADLGINPLAHGQIAEHTDIPKRYYDRMLTEQPGLLAHNVNTWLEAKPAKRLVRTLDGRVRAFMSNKYRPLDNLGLAEAALPTLTEMGAQVISSELTERRFYIKVIFPGLSDEVPEGLQLGVGHHKIDLVTAGLSISNSEVGAGRLLVEPLVQKHGCTNLLIVTESVMAKYHIGRANEVENVRELLSDEAKRADDAAIWLAVRDVVRGAANPENFKRVVAQMHAAAGQALPAEADIPKVVELIQEKFTLPERAGKSILQHLIRGGELSQWGVVNAVTRTAEDTEDYEDATDLERAGGKVLALDPSEWKQLTDKAAA